jgi:hypothetical protein
LVTLRPLRFPHPRPSPRSARRRKVFRLLRTVEFFRKFRGSRSGGLIFGCCRREVISAAFKNNQRVSCIHTQFQQHRPHQSGLDFRKGHVIVFNIFQYARKQPLIIAWRPRLFRDKRGIMHMINNMTKLVGRAVLCPPNA